MGDEGRSAKAGPSWPQHLSQAQPRVIPESPRSPPKNEPPAKVRKLSKNFSDEMDGETCPICFEPWSNSGEHRVVSLKCGHLFGLQCVERWLKAQGAKNRSCPTCKTKTTMRDIRPLYASRLVAADDSQIATLQKQIDTLQAEKSQVEVELRKLRLLYYNGGTQNIPVESLNRRPGNRGQKRNHAGRRMTDDTNR